MSAKHNLKFLEAAILRLRADVVADTALLESLLRDASSASVHEDLADYITEIAQRCVANDEASKFLQKSLPTPPAPKPQPIKQEPVDDDEPGPVGRPPKSPSPPSSIKENELRARSATFRKSMGEGPGLPPTDKKKKT